MTIRAVIFDLGGVLVRTLDFSVREQMAARLGITRLALEEMIFNGASGTRAQLGQLQADEHWRGVCRGFNIPEQQIEAFQNEFWQTDFVDIGLVDYIRNLRKTYRTALLSNAFSDLRKVINERWNFADAFDVMVISSEIGLMKPDPRIYRLVLEQVNVAPAEAVFVDDFEKNVEGARAAGLHAIHFQDRERVIAELDRLLRAG